MTKQFTPGTIVRVRGQLMGVGKASLLGLLDEAEDINDITEKAKIEAQQNDENADFSDVGELEVEPSEAAVAEVEAIQRRLIASQPEDDETSVEEATEVEEPEAPSEAEAIAEVEGDGSPEAGDMVSEGGPVEPEDEPELTRGQKAAKTRAENKAKAEAEAAGGKVLSGEAEDGS